MLTPLASVPATKEQVNEEQQWHKLRVESRGSKVTVFWDGRETVSYEGLDKANRNYLTFWVNYTEATYRNIKVTATDGKVLFEKPLEENREDDHRTDRSLLDMEHIYDFANTVEIRDVKEILDRQKAAVTVTAPDMRKLLLPEGEGLLLQRDGLQTAVSRLEAGLYDTLTTTVEVTLDEEGNPEEPYPLYDAMYGGLYTAVSDFLGEMEGTE